MQAVAIIIIVLVYVCASLCTCMCKGLPRWCPYYCGSVHMLAQAVNDLYLNYVLIRTSELCCTTEVHSMNSYWGCGQLCHFETQVVCSYTDYGDMIMCAQHLMIFTIM